MEVGLTFRVCSRWVKEIALDNMVGLVQSVEGPISKN